MSMEYSGVAIILDSRKLFLRVYSREHCFANFVMSTLKRTRTLPQEPPSEAFVAAVVRKFRSKFAEAGGTMSEEVWAKIIKDSQAEVTGKYSKEVKREFLFENVSQLRKKLGVDLRSNAVPVSEEELTSRLQALRDALAKSGALANYEFKYDELADAFEARQPTSAEVGTAPIASLKKPEPEPEEKKDDPPLKARIKKAREGAKGRMAAEDVRMKRLRDQASDISQRLQRAGAPMTTDIMKELTAIRTGLDFSNVDFSRKLFGGGEEIVMPTLLDLAQQSQLSAKYKNYYKYLGAYRGSLEALQRGDAPINQLDALAAIHDLAYLEASAEKDQSLREQAIKRADEEFVLAARSLGDSDQDEDVRSDAKTAALAISGKGLIEGVVGQFDLTTAGVKKLTREQLIEKTNNLISEMKGYVTRLVDPKIRAELEENIRQITEIEAEVHPVAKGAVSGLAVQPVVKGAVSGIIHATSPITSSFPPPPPSPLDPGQAAEQSQVETVGAPGGIEKKSMGLDDVLKSLAKMNASTNPLSITPVTGERNLRPLLVKGDVPDIVKRTPKEIADNRNYYAAWKWVQEGAGNGNQQPLPDQVGMPANNRIWDMQKRNERFKYRDNYDGGAKEWYQHKKATLGKYVRTVPLVRKKYVIPMYSDNQRHQWPTRNGGLPAGCGSVIKMARDKADGFEIFSPTQVLMAKQTRLFHGDVIESEGRLTRV